jgi:multiple sugar transport system substrate-binding protein
VEITAVPAPEEPVTLNWFTYSAAPDHIEDMNAMIAVFESQNPNIKINMETAPWGEYFSLLKTKIASGQAPDVFELNYEGFVEYASKGVLLDMSSQMQADKDFDVNVFYPRALNAFNYNGLQLGLPSKFDTVVLFYNKDIFDEAGVAYPTAEWTMDDAVTAAKQIQEELPDVWGLYSPIQFWEFYKKAAQNGCEIFNEDMTEVLINSEACVDTVETMVGLITEEGVQPAESEFGGLKNEDFFAQGKLAMDILGIWMFSTYQDADFNWDIAVEPGLKVKATHFFSDAFVTFAATKHPEAAWKWEKFLTSSEEMVNLRLETGWSLPALNEPELFEDYLNRDNPENRQAVFESLEYAVVPPVITRQNEMTSIVGNYLEKVTLGQLSAQEALDQIKIEVEALIQ